MKNRIRQLREERHMTQVRLSIELGVSQETISAYEKQKHDPSFTQLAKMSDIFHASIDYIMGLSSIRTPSEAPEDFRLMQIFGLSRALSQKQLELVGAYIQGLMDMEQAQKADLQP